MASSLLFKKPVLNFPRIKLADLRLSYDDTKWEKEILEALSEQYPDLPSLQIKVGFNVKDRRNGFAVGHASVDNAIKIPIIVDGFQLRPFDVFLKDGELHTLSQASLKEALTPTHFGDPVPAGQGEASDIFLTHSRPPFDGKYTFASWAGGDQKKVEEALTNVFGPDGVHYYKADDARFSKLLQDSQTGGLKNWPVKGKLTRFENQSLGAKPSAIPIKEAEIKQVGGGFAKCAGPDGRGCAGIVFDHVLDLDLGPRELRLFVPADASCYGLEKGLLGEQITKVADMRTLQEQDPRSGDTGIFWWVDRHDRAWATEPLTIQDIAQHKLGTLYFTKGASVRTHKIVHDERLAFPAHEGDLWRIPAVHWLPVKLARRRFGVVTPFDRDFTAIFSQRGQFKVSCYQTHFPERTTEWMSKQAARNHLKHYYEIESIDAVLELAQQRGQVKIAGVVAEPPVAPTVDTRQIDTLVRSIRDDAKIAVQALADTGVPASGQELRELASFMQQQDVPIFAALAKQAADIIDDEGERVNSVDQALGLNILTPEIINRYMDGVDQLERARQFALRLLIAGRLGMTIDVEAARTAAFALDRLVRSMRQLRTMHMM